MNNSNDNNELLIKKLLSYGKDCGATQMQVSAGFGDDFSVEVRNGNIETLTEAGSKSIGIKVIVDNKVATASSSDFNEDVLKDLIAGAVERAQLATEDPFSGLPEEVGTFVNPDTLELFDPKILELTPEQKINFAKECERIALADPRIKLSAGSFFSSGTGTVMLMNSKGFKGSYSFTNCGGGVYLQAGDDDAASEDGWYSGSVQLSQLLSPEEIAKIAVFRTSRLMGARKVDTQNVPVIFEPQMTSSLLGFLSYCLSGGSIYLKQSFLTGKLGEKIFGDNINIIDDGLIPGAPGSKPFDREGVPIRKTGIIDKGLLNSYILDTYSARKLNLKSTGNASGTGNFYLQPGNNSPEDIIKSVDKGLLLVRTIGQGTSVTTGDISKGAFGLWIENGEIAYPVAEITISGNLQNIFNSVEMLGNDLKFDRSITGPTIKVSELTVSGR